MSNKTNKTINSKIVLKGIKQETMPSIKILEPYFPEVIECETTDDFNEIINSDPDKYKSLTTQKLNKTFKIPGYKITKAKGEICLRSIKPCERQDNVKYEEKLEALNEEIKSIKDAFNKLSEQFDVVKSLLLPEGNENN